MTEVEDLLVEISLQKYGMNLSITAAEIQILANLLIKGTEIGD